MYIYVCVYIKYEVIVRNLMNCAFIYGAWMLQNTVHTTK